MKKILFYIIIFVIICFGIPILFTNKKDNTKEVSTIQENVQSNEQNEIKEYDYKQYNKIKLNVIMTLVLSHSVQFCRKLVGDMNGKFC